jgi:hypothetical protein
MSFWACQNWIVTVPVGLLPEGGAELDPEDPPQAATVRVNAAIPASAIRFILVSLFRQPRPPSIIP